MKFTYDTYLKYRKRRQKKRLIIGNNQYNCESLFLYVLYIFSLLNTCRINNRKFTNLVLKNGKLLNKWNISERTFYLRLIPTLTELGIINQIKPASSFPYKICALYEVDKYKLYDTTIYLMDKLYLNKSELEFNNLLYLLYNTILPPSYIYSLNNIYMNKTCKNLEIVELESLMRQRLKTFDWIPDEIYDDLTCRMVHDQIKNDTTYSTYLKTVRNEHYLYKDMIEWEYLKHMCQSPLVKTLYKEEQWLVDHGIDYIKCDLKAKWEHWHLKLTGRQYDSKCVKLKKTERKEQLITEGIDGEFDLHSSIFAVTRLINKGLFDADWDMKTEMAKNNYFYSDGTVLERSDFKKDDRLLYRTYFADTVKRAYKDYSNIKREQKLNEEEFTRLFNDVRDTIGDVYGGAIFIYESILIYKVLRRLVERGSKVGTAYDCIYFESNKVSEKEIKEIINESAYEMLKDIKGE